jgi:cobalt-precorrin 5A hydrolase/precorrin-3B C17-methyltransferase
MSRPHVPDAGSTEAIGIGLSVASLPALRTLRDHALVGRVVVPAGVWERLLELQPAAMEAVEASDDIGGFLRDHWGTSEAFVVAGACGAVTRLIAPCLRDKHRDPAVVVIDPGGRHALPLVGGHAAGGDALAAAVAAGLGGSTVLTGASSGREDRMPLDCFGGAWGWQRGSGDWDALMRRAAGNQPLRCRVEGGLELWNELPGAARLIGADDGAGTDGNADMTIGPRRGPGCRWHPPMLWLGVGCERHTSAELIEQAVSAVLAEHGLAREAVAGLASLDLKGDETGLLALAAAGQWPLRLFAAGTLAEVPVPSPSARVAAEVGTASVAEAASLLAAGPRATLLVGKRIRRAGPGQRGAVTVAVACSAGQWAPHRGRLDCVGSGPGSLDQITAAARTALAGATVWVGYGLYLDLLEPLRRPDQLRIAGQLTQERERCARALDLACRGLPVALISSGDSGIYGMAGLALSLRQQLPEAIRPAFAVHPGISALQMLAARAGAPLMHDFCTVSLSDRLTPWPVIERRLEGAARGDFVVALYNPRSRDRSWQLGQALAILRRHRDPGTPVALGRQLGRPQETVSLHRLDDVPVAQVDMLTLVLIGNSSTCRQGEWMITPRGYRGGVTDPLQSG